MRIKVFALLVLLFTTSNLIAQKFSNKDYINKVHNIYETELNLSKKQSVVFKTILRKYNKKIEKLYNLENQNKDTQFNRLVKIQDLEIHKIISVSQFSKYKEVKSRIEPFKKYKK